MTSHPDAVHTVPLANTPWRLWQEFMLRSTGFPVAGLALLGEPALAAAAEEMLAGADPAATERWRKEADAAWLTQRQRLTEIAADPAFREAVTWQNRSVLPALDRLTRTTGARVRPSDRRQAERVVVRYWQRYAAKNETIGFFGPGVWGRLDADGPPLEVVPGPGLVVGRRVRFEDWALAVLAERIGADPALRPRLPVHRAPQLALVGRELRQPVGPAVELGPLEAALVAGADGRDATALADAVVAEGRARTREDALASLERLVAKGYLRWGLDVPASQDAEEMLAAQLAALPDPAARAPLTRLTVARDAVAAAAGDPAALAAALGELDRVFAAETGADPQRRPGQMYAGRSLVYEDGVRDLTIRLHPAVLDAVAAPLAVLLRAAEWLCGELARTYGAALDELYDELAGDGDGDGDGDGAAVPLADLWFLAQGLLFGSGARPVDAVAVDFLDRWQRLLGIGASAAEETEVVVDAAGLTDRLAAAFPAPPAGWRAGRLHSPDLHLLAADVEAVGRGEFTVVLGELHAGWASFDCGAITGSHPDPERLRAALAADLGAGRVRVLYPDGWPRFTGRVGPSLVHRDDVRLAFSDGRGAGLPGLLPLAAAEVRRVGGRLTVTVADGATPAPAGGGAGWPVLEVFSDLLAVHAVDGFKLSAATGYSPRVRIGRLVVQRRTWRTTCGASELVTPTADEDRYLAARRLRAALDLPERLFAKIGLQTKPVYVDLTSPALVASFAAMVRSEALAHGPEARLTLSELLPDHDDCWLADAQDRRYHSEIRLHCVAASATDGAERA